MLCYRSLRQKQPKFSVEEKTKIIVHNYGHGGAEWFLSCGSVLYCIQRLLDDYPNVDKSESIAIVGAGYIGLLSAYQLLELGFSHIIAYTRPCKELTSHNAREFLAFRSTYNDLKVKDLVAGLGVKTYKFYKESALGRNKSFPKGAKIIPTYFKNIRPSKLEGLFGKGMKKSKKVILDLGGNVTRPMIAYDDIIFIGAGKMLDQLYELIAKKVKLQKKNIKDLNDFYGKVIFNCTGLGSKNLLLIIY